MKRYFNRKVRRHCTEVVTVDRGVRRRLGTALRQRPGPGQGTRNPDVPDLVLALVPDTVLRRDRVGRSRDVLVHDPVVVLQDRAISREDHVRGLVLDHRRTIVLLPRDRGGLGPNLVLDHVPDLVPEEADVLILVGQWILELPRFLEPLFRLQSLVRDRRVPRCVYLNGNETYINIELRLSSEL